MFPMPEVHIGRHHCICARAPGLHCKAPVQGPKASSARFQGTTDTKAPWTAVQGPKGSSARANTHYQILPCKHTCGWLLVCKFAFGCQVSPFEFAFNFVLLLVYLANHVCNWSLPFEVAIQHCVIVCLLGQSCVQLVIMFLLFDFACQHGAILKWRGYS